MLEQNAEKMQRAIAYLQFRLTPEQRGDNVTDAAIDNAEYILTQAGGADQLAGDMETLIEVAGTMMLSIVLVGLQRQQASSNEACLARMRKSAEKYRSVIDEILKEHSPAEPANANRDS
jgi:hypothetical protein